MTKKQTNALKNRCQGWQLAKQRLLSLLSRLRVSAQIAKDLATDAELEKIERVHKKTIDALIRVNKHIQQNSIIAKTYTGLRCPRCKEHSVKLSLVYSATKYKMQPLLNTFRVKPEILPANRSKLVGFLALRYVVLCAKIIVVMRFEH